MKWPPFFFLVGRGEGEFFLFFKLCLVWRMGCPLFTFHLESGQLTLHVPQRVLNSTSLLSHMLGKRCPPFKYIYLGQRGGTWHFKIEPSILWSLCSFLFFEWWANQMLLIWGIICGGLHKKSLQLECTLYTYICSLSPVNSWIELAAQVMQSGHTLHRHMCAMSRQCAGQVFWSLSLSLRMIMKAELI